MLQFYVESQLEKYAMIGAGSAIVKNVPDYALVVGKPERKIGWVDEKGNRLKFDTSGKVNAEDFILIRKKLVLSEEIRRLQL